MLLNYYRQWLFSDWLVGWSLCVISGAQVDDIVQPGKIWLSPSQLCAKLFSPEEKKGPYQLMAPPGKNTNMAHWRIVFPPIYSCYFFFFIISNFFMGSLSSATWNWIERLLITPCLKQIERKMLLRRCTESGWKLPTEKLNLMRRWEGNVKRLKEKTGGWTPRNRSAAQTSAWCKITKGRV